MIGILGGSFDPVHNGHLAMALLAQQQCKLDSVLFIPCKHHPLAKQYQATDAQRIAMLALALAPYPQFKLDQREMYSEETSYTINTLKSLHKSYPDETLVLILGMDVLAQLDQWHEWQQLTQYANLLIVQRNSLMQADLNPAIKAFIAQQPKGKITFLDNAPINISATAIRNHEFVGSDLQQQLPANVFNYIQEQKIYC